MSEEFKDVRVLCADDDDTTLKVMKSVFAKDYNLFLARDGIEALEMIEKHNIRVVLTDLQMPRLNGMELCKKMRAKHPLSLICAITGHSKMFELVECRDLGFDDYLLKPVDIYLLQNTMREMVARYVRWLDLIKSSGPKPIS